MQLGLTPWKASPRNPATSPSLPGFTLAAELIGKSFTHPVEGIPKEAGNQFQRRGVVGQRLVDLGLCAAAHLGLLGWENEKSRRGRHSPVAWIEAGQA